MRRFVLRQEGTDVAEGVEFSDGTVTVRTRNATILFNTTHDVDPAYGMFVWVDDEAELNRFRVYYDGVPLRLVK